MLMNALFNQTFVRVFALIRLVRMNALVLVDLFWILDKEEYAKVNNLNFRISTLKVDI